MKWNECETTNNTKGIYITDCLPDNLPSGRRPRRRPARLERGGPPELGLLVVLLLLLRLRQDAVGLRGRGREGALGSGQRRHRVRARQRRLDPGRRARLNLKWDE